MQRRKQAVLATLVCAMALAAVMLLVPSASRMIDQLIPKGASQPTAAEAQLPDETAKVPILMYHALTEDPGKVSDMTITRTTFAKQMAALSQAGYVTVNYDDLENYVTQEKALREKAVVLTFDDGYESNLTLAAPVLEQYGFQAQVAVVGCTIGKSVYKNTGKAISPHFTMNQAEPWIDRGILHLNCHSFDLHQVPDLDGKDCRRGVLPKAGESWTDYEKMLRQDYEAWLAVVPEQDRRGTVVYTYPYGKHSPWSEESLEQMGVSVTVTTGKGVAVITRKKPQSLRCLPRIPVTEQVTPEQLLSLLTQ